MNRTVWEMFEEERGKLVSPGSNTMSSFSISTICEMESAVSIRILRALNRNQA